MPHGGRDRPDSDAFFTKLLRTPKDRHTAFTLSRSFPASISAARKRRYPK
jgi:hypothetical protein